MKQFYITQRKIKNANINERFTQTNDLRFVSALFLYICSCNMDGVILLSVEHTYSDLNRLTLTTGHTDQKDWRKYWLIDKQIDLPDLPTKSWQIDLQTDMLTKKLTNWLKVGHWDYQTDNLKYRNRYIMLLSLYHKRQLKERLLLLNRMP